MFRKKISLTKEEFYELLLSHHPNTPEFKDDVVILFKKRVCEGCLIGWPVAIIFILLNPFPVGVYLPLAFIFMFISLLRKFSKNAYVRRVCKGFAGLAIGSGFLALYNAIITSNYLYIILLFIGFLFYLFLRIRKLSKILLTLD